MIKLKDEIKRVEAVKGNVVLCGDNVVMTDKVFTENNRDKYDVDFLKQLEQFLSENRARVLYDKTVPSFKTFVDYFGPKKDA